MTRVKITFDPGKNRKTSLSLLENLLIKYHREALQMVFASLNIGVNVL